MASVVSLVDSIDLTVLTMYGYHRYFTVITPRNALTIDGTILAKVRALPLTAKMYPTRPAITVVKTIFGKMPFVVFGLPPEARDVALKRCHLIMRSGRLPAEDQPEVALSAEIARNRHLHLGSVVLEPNSEDSYAIVPMKLVGTFEGPVWLALSSESFIRNHFPVNPLGCVVMAQTPDGQGALDRALDRVVDKAHARVWTYRSLVRETRDALASLYLIMSVVIGIIVFAIAFLTGMLTNIYFTQRLPEFAILSAIGYLRRTLLGRVLAETALLCGIGWAMGSLLTLAVLFCIKALVMTPRGMLLDPVDLAAYRYTLPLPITIALFAWAAIGHRLLRLDPVSIIERRQ